MEEEKNNAAEVLRGLLKADRTLLTRREELANAVQQSALSRREKLALTKALTTTNICDIFAAADQGTDEDRAAAPAKAAEALAGTKDAEAIAQALYDAMAWETAGETAGEAQEEAPAAEAPEEGRQPSATSMPEAAAEPAAEEAAPAAPWDCVCGQKANTGKFCVSCGRPKDLGAAKAQETWTCRCGQKANTGKFCVACGRSRVEGEAAASAAPSDAPAMQEAPDTPAEDATQVLPRVGEPAQPKPEQRIELQPAPQPAYQQPAYQPIERTGSAHAGGGNKMLIAIIAVLVIAIGAFVFKESSGGDTTSSYNSLAKTSSSSSSSGAAKPAREMKSDLSLGGLDLDMSIDDVKKTLGKENTSEQRGKFNFLLYDDIEVGTYENSVRALVSNGPSAKTKRGIHEGSTYDEVKKAYGTDCASMDYDDLMLYEYSFKSISGNDGLLRFAIKKSDNTVKYISVRIPEDEKPAAQKHQDPKEAAFALNAYYKAIANHNMKDAYNLLSSDMQSHMGSLDHFSSGYQNTVSNDVSNLRYISTEPDKVVLGYHLKSRDREGSRIVVRDFDGTATLSKATGTWHIVDWDVKQVGEHKE